VNVDLLKSAWFKRLVTVLVAGGMYVLASKVPQFAAQIAALAALLPSGLMAKDGA
jgi:hypothetical protein